MRRVQRPSGSQVSAAVELLSKPIKFGSGQGEATALLGKMATVVCYKCGGNGTIPGKRKARKCRKCEGGGRGYSYAGAVYWSGWPTTETRSEGATL
jgi:DnaJ-class molecular chaperone